MLNDSRLITSGLGAVVPVAARSQADDESFYTFFDEDEVGRFYFLRFVQDVHSPHGVYLLLCNRYRYATHEKRQVAQDIIDGLVAAVTEIWSSEDVDTLIEAHDEGKKPVSKGKATARSKNKARKIQEAKEAVEKMQPRLARGTPADLIDDAYALLKDDLDEYWGAFKRSKYIDLYARARVMELDTVHEDDFHSFRVLGVGGFGAVHAAVKKDTGALLAIKRMDKKLIKHKNRYKSCFTEVTALKAMASGFVCGLHYTYQTKDEVCLVLDLLHGGTLSFLLHQKKKVSERYVKFFTACIVMAYEALHSKGFVYRDMKPANVLIKDNGYAVLIDFGLAAKLDTALKGKCGTRGYWSPEMVKGDQYLYSGDWWSLGVTLVELLTGKKPFKKKFQKYKNTDDKIKICKAGQVEDEIEEKNIESKLGKAKEEEDDGRDSNDEETDDEEEEAAAAAAAAAATPAARASRRSSIRVIGGFDKTVASIVETEAALEYWPAMLAANAGLAEFDKEDFDGGPARLLRLMSLVTFDSEQELMLPGEFGTYLCVVLDGKVRTDDGRDFKEGAIVGFEGLFADNYHRQVKAFGGVQGGTIGIFLYSELIRAKLFDAESMGLVEDLCLAAAGKGGDQAAKDTLQSRLEEFGDMEDTHPEERFIAQCKHTKKAQTAEDAAKKEKELSESKKRDHKIYLTQEVWAKKELLSREAQRFVGGLLTRNVNARLGCGPGGFRNVKEHDWFEDIDWDKLEMQTATAPYIPKKEVNAKEESKMKTFNTAGMKKLVKEDQDKWNEWDWTSVIYYRKEMAAYQYEQWGHHDYKKRGGGGGGGGCCEIS